MTLHESAEDYLETILKLQEKNGQVRSIEIAEDMGFSKPSISRAIRLLRENGYLEMDVHGNIILLPKGQAIAENIYSRHKALTNFFVRLGIDEEIAADDACKIEHDLNEVTFQKLMELDRMIAEKIEATKAEAPKENK